MLTWFAALALAVAALLFARVATGAALSGWWLLVLTPALFAALRVLSVAVARGLVAALERMDAFVEAGRLRRALWMLRAAGWLSHVGTLTTGNRRLRARYLRRAAQQHEAWGRWEDVLAAAGRLARMGSADTRLLAYNLMLRALVMLGRREAFSYTFAALESLFAGAAGADAGQVEAGDERFRPLAHANHLRALLAFRDADLDDALHWIARARRLDPDYVEPLLLEADIAGWRDDWEAGRRVLGEAEALVARNEPRWRERTDMLLRLLQAAGGESEADAERHRAALGRAVDNERWRVAWGWLRLAALTRRPAAIEATLEREGALGEGHAGGRVQVRLARMVMESLRKEGNAMEKPYAEALHAMRREPIPAALWAEVPFWRALALLYRGQFAAMMEKWAEFDALPAWVRPPLVEVARRALTAHALDRLGRSSEAEPLRAAAAAAAPEGHRIAWMALGRRERLTPRLPAE